MIHLEFGFHQKLTFAGMGFCERLEFCERDLPSDADGVLGATESVVDGVLRATESDRDGAVGCRTWRWGCGWL
jgi:hypothetical protein